MRCNTKLWTHLLSECSQWVFLVSILSECSQWVFSLSVLSDCSQQVFSVSVLSECSRWVFSVSVLSERSQWVFSVPTNFCTWLMIASLLAIGFIVFIAPNRVATKEAFNRQFGSIFRTYHNPSFFTSRLCRYADLYMSSVSNLLQYPTDHTFYPRRSALPHEINFNTILRWKKLDKRWGKSTERIFIRCHSYWDRSHDLVVCHMTESLHIYAINHRSTHLVMDVHVF